MSVLSFALHHVAFYWRVLKWNTHTVQHETYRISYITVTRPASLDSITVTERVCECVFATCFFSSFRLSSAP